MDEPRTAEWWGLRSGAFVSDVAGARCVLEPASGHWRWEVLDARGERVEHGAASTRETAAEAARSAALGWP